MTESGLPKSDDYKFKSLKTESRCCGDQLHFHITFEGPNGSTKTTQLAFVHMDNGTTPHEFAEKFDKLGALLRGEYD